MEQTRIVKYTKLIIGSIFFSLAVYLFITPSDLNSGGIIGFAQLFASLIEKTLHLDKTIDLTGIINVFLNLPLFILAFRSISKEFCFKALLSVLVQMACLSFFPKRDLPLMDDVLSNVIFGAIIGGVGVGLTLQSSGCAGGWDILGVYLSKVKPNFSVGRLAMIANGILFLVTAMISDVQNAMHSIIFVVVMYFVCDRVHYQNINITAMIFTKTKEVQEQILKRTGRGVTYWNGKGAFTDQDLYVLVTALNKYEIRFFKKIVYKADPNAFVIFSEGSNITGNFEKRL